ncbi:MAG: radical SAM/Cys-rich domain protein [Oscillatoriales cyanobacterium]|nr:MAG: radical SAM/Cys-rich domain protein [Oscillatoriales cyanobacterium]
MLITPSAALELLPFDRAINQPLAKQLVRVLQINLGKRCNLACSHCHVEAGPHRTEELTPEITQQLIDIIQQFPQLETVDLTGGAPEMNYGFRELVAAAFDNQKSIIVRSNLTIFFVEGFEDLPDFFAQHDVRVVASLPCYLAENVDRQRGSGVFDRSIEAIQRLNQLGYGQDPALQLDLVYNPPVPRDRSFSLPPAQSSLEQAYRQRLKADHNIDFNHLLTITNLPIGRTKLALRQRNLEEDYCQFLASNFNAQTLAGLMCLNQLSVDYRGYLYDCDFNQMEDIPARSPDGKMLTLADLLAANSLDLVTTVQTDRHCYGCTAGSGSSCGGAIA